MALVEPNPNLLANVRKHLIYQQADPRDIVTSDMVSTEKTGPRRRAFISLFNGFRNRLMDQNALLIAMVRLDKKTGQIKIPSSRAIASPNPTSLNPIPPRRAVVGEGGNPQRSQLDLGERKEEKTKTDVTSTPDGDIYSAVVFDQLSKIGKPLLRRYEAIVGESVIVELQLIGHDITGPAHAEVNISKKGDGELGFVAWKLFDTSFHSWDATSHVSGHCEFKLMDETDLIYWERVTRQTRDKFRPILSSTRFLRWHGITSGAFVLLTNPSSTAGFEDEPHRVVSGHAPGSKSTVGGGDDESKSS